MNNFRYPLTLFIASFVMVFVGLMFKIMHWPGGQLITGSMMMVQAIAIIWLVVIIFKSKK